MKTKLACLLISLCVSIAMVSLAHGQPDIKAGVEMPKMLIFSTGQSPNSTPALMGKNMAKILNKAFPNTTNRWMPGVPGKNATLIQNKQVHIANMSAVLLKDVWYGGTKAYPNPMRDMRQLFCFTVPLSGGGVLVLKDSPIKGYEDMLGPYKHGVDFPGGSWFPVFSYGLKKAYGFSTDDVKAKGGLIYHGKKRDSLDMLAEGKLDSVGAIWTWPYPSIEKLHMLRGIRWLDPSIKFCQAIADKYPGYIPAKMMPEVYKDQPEINYLALEQTWIVHKDMPEDVVYNILAAFLKDDGRSLNEVKPLYKKAKPPYVFFENSAKATHIPWHPGAKKYYEERGVTLSPPEWKLTD